ncbi:MAG: hypothetical protein QCH35_09840 [Methanomicrobiaceae archaeon]|nr:hypothetical protein [Methanomicrobiaceae archaeon]
MSGRMIHERRCRANRPEPYLAFIDHGARVRVVEEIIIMHSFPERCDATTIPEIPARAYRRIVPAHTIR